METRICPACSKPFTTYPSVVKECCSRVCANRLRSEEIARRRQRECAVCGAVFVPKHPKSPGIFCSHKCRGIADRKERVDRNGYWYVCKPEHPRASSQGYVAEHTLVMEAAIGRLLRDDEVVHHKNHDRKDNRLSNLQLMTDAEHKALHMREQNEAGLMNTKDQRLRSAERASQRNQTRRSARGPDGKFVRTF